MNPFDLSDLDFAVVFVVVTCQVALMAGLVRRWLRQGSGRDPTSGDTDTYALGYLAGGPATAVQAAVIAQVQRGRLASSGDGVLRRGPTSGLVPAPELYRGGVRDTDEHPLERAVVHAAGDGRPLSGVIDRVDDALLAIEARLVEHGLLAGRGASRRVRAWSRGLLLLVIALGLDRLMFGFVDARARLVVLVTLALNVLLVRRWWWVSRSTDAGRRRLERARNQHASLALTASSAPQQLDPPHAALAYALFGAAVAPALLQPVLGTGYVDTTVAPAYGVYGCGGVAGFIGCGGGASCGSADVSCGGGDGGGGDGGDGGGGDGGGGCGGGCGGCGGGCS